MIRQRVIYFSLSFIFHLLILFMLSTHIACLSPIPVVENSNKKDTINVVILGETTNSKVATPRAQMRAEGQSIAQSKPPKLSISDQKITKKNSKEDVVPLKIVKPNPQKMVSKKQSNPSFGKDLLADIKRQQTKKQAENHKKLKSQFEKMLHQQTEKSLRQQLLNEEIQLIGKQQRLAQGIINRYKALIIQTISEHWVVPSGVNKKLFCELMIRLDGSGTVLDVQVTKSSGDTALDSSARLAVLKASPLPVPKAPDAFEAFKQFVLKVKPEYILSADKA